MLTAKSTELDRVLGLELGADDYLTKPFSLAELLARVKALLRRADLLRAAQADAQAQSQAIRNGELEILPAKRQVRYRGEAIDFTALEFDLLLHFARHPGHVFSRSQLLNAVWGYTPRRLRAHRDDAHQPPARQARGRSDAARADPHGARRRLQDARAPRCAHERAVAQARADDLRDRPADRAAGRSRPSSTPSSASSTRCVPRAAWASWCASSACTTTCSTCTQRGPGRSSRRWLRSLVLYEPDTQLYLLDRDGTVLAKTGKVRLAPGFKVALGAGARRFERQQNPDASFVMGDDPERMDADAVVAAKPVRGADRRRAARQAGYLYLVAHTRQLPGLALGGAAQQLRAAGARRVIAASSPLTTLLAVAHHRVGDAAAAPADRRRSRRCRSAASPRAGGRATQTLLPPPTARRVRPADRAPSR